MCFKACEAVSFGLYLVCFYLDNDCVNKESLGTLVVQYIFNIAQYFIIFAQYLLRVAQQISYFGHLDNNYWLVNNAPFVSHHYSGYLN